ncbi:MAG TPA: heme-binding domain-containing protein, partial [Bacteroidales bacterium]|nr:heme-binding domain-containing protein [Bacteroidales bacterium]
VPQTDSSKDFMSIASPPQEIQALIHEACYDCHSFETQYPWYSYIQPVSWFLQGHIDEAREHMNFSEWAKYSIDTRKEKMEHASKMVSNRKMPLWSFRIEHPEARLTDQEIKTLANWFDQRRERLSD